MLCTTSTLSLSLHTTHLIDCAVVGSWLTNEEGGGEWTIDASGKTTLDNTDYGPKYYIKEDPTGVLRRGDGWESRPESTSNRLVWNFKSNFGGSFPTSVVWTRRHRLELHQGMYILLHWCRHSVTFIHHKVSFLHYSITSDTICSSHFNFDVPPISTQKIVQCSPLLG